MDTFTIDTIQNIADEQLNKDINWKLKFSDSDFLVISKHITDLNLGLKSRKDCIVDLLLMSRNVEYGQSCVLEVIANLIKKSPTAAIKDSVAIGEAELWSTIFQIA